MVNLVLLALFAINPSFKARDVYGRYFKPFRVEEKAQVLFFLSAECSAASAQLASPKGFALDRNGNVFIADSSNQRIRKITPRG